jgi:predicted nucleotidyltransferase
MQPAVQNKTSLMELLRAHGSVIRSFGVSSLGLFGSFVKNSVEEDSDVDLFIDFDPGRKLMTILWTSHSFSKTY